MASASSMVDILVPDALLPSRPVLKWAGGKSQLLTSLRAAMPLRYKRYAEPFLGGGALFFNLARPGALVSDTNSELIQFYRCVRDDPGGLLRAVSQMTVTEDDYYRVRSLDPTGMEPLDRAARFAYLNKTCFNGLHRVNKKGQFNTPFGGKTTVTILDPANLWRASAVLKTAEVACMPYMEALEQLEEGDFVYLDPPYVPVGRFSDFKRYTREFFGPEDHIRLASVFRSLSERGVAALLSNSASEQVERLYEGFPLMRVSASRQINCLATRRGKITELLIANYPLESR